MLPKRQCLRQQCVGPRQNVPVIEGQVQSPQQCREVLGDALYLLRFPTMTPADFANGPGQSGLLNMQETNDLFFHFAADNKPKLCFPTTSRKGRLRSCVRFKMTNKIWCNPGSRCDSICFSVDKSISVVGFGMYRCSSTKPVRVYIALKQSVYTLRQNAFVFLNASKDTVAHLFLTVLYGFRHTLITLLIWIKFFRNTPKRIQALLVCPLWIVVASTLPSWTAQIANVALVFTEVRSLKFSSAKLMT